jgi:hypothetical protein
MPPPDSASPYAAALRSKGPELAGPRARTRATWTADQSPAVLWDTVRKAGSVSGERERRTGGNSGLHDVSLKPTARQSATTAPNNASVGSTAPPISRPARSLHGNLFVHVRIGVPVFMPCEAGGIDEPPAISPIARVTLDKNSPRH